MKNWIAVVFALIISNNYLTAQTTLIPYGADWKYYDLTNTPPSQSGTQWYESLYNDSNWSDGKSHMGYGDGDESTVVNANTQTFYARTTFEVNSPSEYPSITLNLIYDDGAIIYLNDEEVWRVNMPTGNIVYTTYSVDISDENARRSTTLFDALRSGVNNIAVEIHQSNAGSSDMSFDLSLTSGTSTTNSVLNESNLPIIIITTDDNRNIIDEPKIPASMKIIYNEDGSINQIDQEDLHFDGRIGIELRGQSSLDLFPKKGYGIETRDAVNEDLDVALLGFPEEEDWVIHSPYSDKSLIRNALAYHWAGQIMAYAPRIKMCELIINDEYLGVVLFTEKIKRDKARVDINKLKEDENSGDDLTGGYILKFDKGDSDEFGWSSPYDPLLNRSTKTNFYYHYPKPEDITSEQRTYIRNHMTKFEDVLMGSNFKDRNNGYRKYIDVNSFIDLFIINEISRNVDGYRLSTYMYKDKDSDGGLLKMGPVWDYNLAFGNANYCDGSRIFGWAYRFNDVCPNDMWVNHVWWERLLQDETFKQEFKDRYAYFRQSMLSDENIEATIDSLVNILDVPAQRNFQKWRVLNQYIWPNDFVGINYNSEIDYLKNWIRDRLQWLDSSINSLTTATEEIDFTSPVQIYPNPSKDLIHLVSDPKVRIDRLVIHNATGAEVLVMKDDNGIIQHNLQAGLYIVRVKSDDGRTFIQKLIVQ